MGLEMLAQLRQQAEFAATPVVMLSAWSDQEKMRQATALGVLHFLVKPFTKAQLVEKAGRVVSLTLKSGEKPPVETPRAPQLSPRLVTPSTPKAAVGAPVPDNVIRIAKLVALHEVDLEEIATIVENDKYLSTRLLHMANANLEEGDEVVTMVSEALARNGIGAVFLLAMGDLVMRALLSTFRDMLGIKLTHVDLKKAEFSFDMHVLSEMEFSGQTRGNIYLHVDQRSARRLVSQMMLGTIAPEAATSEQIDLTLSELTNIVVGNFLSNLSDAGMRSQISAPKIGRSTDSRLNAVSGGVAERLAFRSPEMSMLMDISIDPWNH